MCWFVLTVNFCFRDWEISGLIHENCCWELNPVEEKWIVSTWNNDKIHRRSKRVFKENMPRNMVENSKKKTKVLATRQYPRNLQWLFRQNWFHSYLNASSLPSVMVIHFPHSWIILDMMNKYIIHLLVLVSACFPFIWRLKGFKIIVLCQSNASEFQWNS